MESLIGWDFRIFSVSSRFKRRQFVDFSRGHSRYAKFDSMGELKILVRYARVFAMEKDGKTLVFIDDSGDPGFKDTASSEFFVMAAIVIFDYKEATRLNQIVDEIKTRHGWNTSMELKFHKSSRKNKCEFLSSISYVNFEIYAIYVEKGAYSRAGKNVDTKNLYNRATQKLIALIPYNNLFVVLDGKYSKNYRRYVGSFLRENLNLGAKKIASFNVRDSARDNLVQVADFVAGAINRSMRKSKSDGKEYLRLIRHKIVKLRKLDL